MKTILSKPIELASGYIVDGFHIVNENGSGFALIRKIGWCEFSNKLSAILIPNVGWVTY